MYFFRLIKATNTALNTICPSVAYIKTIAIGMKETYHFSNDVIIDYLIGKTGINDGLQKYTILSIIDSLSKSDNVS